MAFTELERSICNKLGFDSGGLLNGPEAAKGAVNNQLSGIKAQLSGYVPSSQAAIDAATAALISNANSIFPGDSAADVQAMIDLINSCAYLEGDDKLTNPISLAKALTDSLFGKLNDFFGDAASIPEYLLGKLMSALDELYGNQLPGSSALTDVLKNSDKLINCLSNLCNGEYTSQVIALTNQTQSLYNDLEMVSNPLDPNYGLLDKDKLYSDAGLIPGDIAKITSANDEVNSLKAEGQSSIDSLMGSIKTLKKAGDIIF
jgi:hypothetical protein